MASEAESDYIRCSTDEVILKLSTNKSGLSFREAKIRLEKLGSNILSDKKERSMAIRFLSHFVEPMILILVFASVLSFIMGEKTDAIIIGCIVLFGVILDFVQEYSADKALKKLMESVVTTTTVMREGKTKEIRISDIVVGDIITLNSGDMIPADARILEAKDFFVNQSAITGESFPAEKSIGIPKENASIQEMTNIVFRGTNVVSGSATAVIIKTGKNTE
jgi:Mg2+-importing ATPase